MTKTGLFLDHVSIRLDGRALLAVTSHVAAGEVLTLMGPSGSGKSTLLAYIGGFLDPAFSASGKVFAGEIELTALPAEERHAGLLFQDPLVGNLAFAIPPGLRGREKRVALAEETLEGVGLAGMGGRDADILSGGQKARVALARVLISSPRLLLLDEPFSKLDQDLRQQMRELAFAKARDAGLPVILVTHDEADAAAAGGPVIRIGT
jgi:putative thiamine transport system ATP-binding protein